MFGRLSSAIAPAGRHHPASAIRQVLTCSFLRPASGFSHGPGRDASIRLEDADARGVGLADLHAELDQPGQHLIGWSDITPARFWMASFSREKSGATASQPPNSP